MNSIVEKIISNASKAHLNLSPAELVEQAIARGEGHLTNTGALAADTGEFTGRSPKDKFVVYDENTNDSVWWGDINNRFESDKFDQLLDKVIAHYQGKEVFVRDAYACADSNYRLNIKVVNETAYQNLFANNLFLRPTQEELKSQQHDWLILAAPSFRANPEVDGTRQHNFAILNFTKKIILIGGTGYTGEIKKGIFAVLNYVLPHERNTLSMHCSANIGKDGDTAIFFGLSGTGKTTLSADPARKLIGDDEHGWADGSVFNFEGGCYAKCIDLTQEKEPQIYNAIRFGALVENVRMIPGTRDVDYTNVSVTENTRAAYPIDLVDNIAVPSVGDTPKNIFFLTADAFGVLPPISRLTAEQAMYHFISGYTAKVAGTEAGVTEPQATFSACFGKAFLPLHPGKYAAMLGEKLKESGARVWLINTGWTGGPYGVGSRMKLSYTRAMITAALEGKLDNVSFETLPVFGLQMPSSCPDVPSEILNPRNTWSDAAAYDAKAAHLAELFVKNFAQFEDGVNDDIKAAAPKATSAAN
ncbi:MAG: phosphoenolpyruvate carboxykinase (ATP) [Bacteroidota bacterium]|nr:phosphoenolpyruvate carboxykinase (ATP) [Bacteroidota bacterium]MDX5430295.1 phosphoenolpyruvate carboxykinase (ATP) [Bacteroidota bacterium]MDX5469056.1 phosphoenolpyruvate carboxykinase (ATP) [Bacteroidota bacterium]